MDDLLDIAPPAQPLERFLCNDEGGDRPVAKGAPATIGTEAVADETILDAVRVERCDHVRARWCRQLPSR